MIEDILADLHRAERDWRIALLRYFNPVGAHASGLVGEDPQGVPNNLLPYVAQVAAGKRDYLSVWGYDYPTPDGTGVRDYIHVCDLAEGHIAALDYLAREGGLLTVNLGTGRGHSVLEMVAAFERASGRPVPYRIAPRRPGDIAQCWADPALAQKAIGPEREARPRRHVRRRLALAAAIRGVTRAALAPARGTARKPASDLALQPVMGAVATAPDTKKPDRIASGLLPHRRNRGLSLI